MVSESLPNICRTEHPSQLYTCKKQDISSCSLHHDIHDVIDTMGPPTPMFPLELECESPDDTAVSTDCTGNTATNSSTTNTSFVEVLIKNHHKNKKVKVLDEKPKPCKNNTAVQTEVKSNKEVQFQDYGSNVSSSPRIINKVNSKNLSCAYSSPRIINNVNSKNLSYTQSSPRIIHKVNSKTLPSGIVTTFSNLPPCPHAPGLNYYPSINKLPSAAEQNKSKPNFSNSQVDDDFRHVDRQSEKIHQQGVTFGRNPSDNHNVQPNNQNVYNQNSNEPPGQPEIMEKAEVYYFDHGNASYYHTTDSPPDILADYLAEKTENAATRFWAQIFGVANILTSIITSFILQLIRFVLFSIVRPLTVGVIQLFSDYFIKPFLSTVFNGLIQPPLIFLFNILTSVRDLFEPIAHALGFFLKEIAVVFRACRLVEIKKTEGTRIV